MKITIVTMNEQQSFIISDQISYLKNDRTVPVGMVPEAACWMIIDYWVFVIVMRKRTNCHEHTVMGFL